MAIERRMISSPGLRILRSEGAGGSLITGHGAVFNQWATLYSGRSYIWREIVRPGAFRNALAAAQDVRALFNHDSNFVLGRTRSGTLRLREDGAGLAYEIDAPDTQLVRELVLSPIDRGDITGSSFAFTVRPEGERTTIREENGVIIEERELVDLDLYDVSPVTHPAYEGSDVALRALGERRDVAVRAQRAARLNAAGRRLRHVEAIQGTILC